MSKFKIISMSILIVFGILMKHETAFAAPYSGQTFVLLQPDQTNVTVKVWGDEYYQRIESLDGFTLIKDPSTKWISYAKLNADGSEFISTGVRYTGKALNAGGAASLSSSFNITPHVSITKESILNKAQKTRDVLNAERNKTTVSSAAAPNAAAAAPLTGSQMGITLLIDFPDDQASVSGSEINNYLNQIGYSNFGNNGSVRDYFREVSNGNLDYTNYVTAYYRAAHNKSYYTDETIPYGQRARELIVEALNWLENDQGFDFSTLSVDGNNNIRAINAFYAGYTQNAWAQGLWPHMSGFSSGTFSADGVHAGVYQITNIGSSLSLRTFAHENGHMLFSWPDLYDYDYNSAGSGNFCLMAYGGSDLNPVKPNPYLRAKAGWENLININNLGTATTLSITSNAYDTYEYINENTPSEYFLIESKVKTGRDTAFPDEGLAIWHIDENGYNGYEQMTCSQHYMVSIEQADGLFELEKNLSYGSSGDLFRAGYKTSFNDTTTPNSNWWCAGASSLSISGISAVGTTMTFKVNPGATYSHNYEHVYLRGTFNAWGSSAMQLTGNNTWQIDVDFGTGDSNGGPRFKFDVNADWSLNFGDNNTDGIADQNGKDISVQANASYTITFNDSTKAYSVVKTGGFISTYPKMNFRGTSDSWSAAPMTLIADYTWQIQHVNFGASASERFKFDVYGDWSVNFGDNTVIDRVGEQNGSDIYVTGLKTYTITFNDRTRAYSIQDENSLYKSFFTSLNFRGTPNSWGNTAMSLVGDNIWRIQIQFGGSSSERFKFDIFGDWTLNYGDNNADGLADPNGTEISVQPSRSYIIEFNDLTKRYTVTAAAP